MADALLKRDIVDTSSFHLLVKRVSCDTEKHVVHVQQVLKMQQRQELFDRGYKSGSQ